MALVSERIHSIAKGKYIGDLVYGSNDGIITTFAVVSGAAGAAISSGVIIVLGVANLIADGISMGVSSYLSNKSRLDFQKKQRAIEEREVDTVPEKEKEEVRVILKEWGIEAEKIEGVVESITKDKKKWVDLMMRDELGIIEETDISPRGHGVVTSLSFISAGTLPLVPYMFGLAAEYQFPVSIIATAVSLFIVGALRVHVTGTNWFKSGLQMLLVGGLAASASYFVGAAVKQLFDITL